MAAELRLLMLSIACCWVCGRDTPSCEYALPAGAQLPMFKSIVSRFPQLRPTVLSTSPWIVQFDSFLTSAEVDRFLELAPASSFVASKMSPVPSQYSDWRTSTSFGCRTCQADPVLRKVFRRVANITGAAADHFEEPQVVRYQQGQQYKTHVDFIKGHVDSPPGPRVLTLLLYLTTSPSPTHGGETVFTRASKQVLPSRGRAILWANTLDDSPNELDRQSFHRSMPVQNVVDIEDHVVEDHVKIAVNLFIRQKSMRCTDVTPPDHCVMDVHCVAARKAMSPEEEAGDQHRTLGQEAAPATVKETPAAADKEAAAITTGVNFKEAAAIIEKSILELRARKAAAVSIEDYDEAKRLKNAISEAEAAKQKPTVQALRGQLLELKAQKVAAVQVEDYDEAKRLKNAISALENVLKGHQEL